MYKITPLDAQVNRNENSTIAKPSFTHYLCGGKGAGKTNLLLNLLTKKQFYRGKFNKIWWVSPTSSLDEKIRRATKVPGILTTNKPLIALMKKDQKNSILSSPIPVPESQIPTSLEDHNFIEELNIAWLTGLIAHQKRIIETYGKKHADSVLVILDDSIANTKILNSNPFKKSLLNSRHYKISMFVTSQSYKLFPKALRNNNSFLSIFEMGSEKQLQEIYEENACGLKWKDWLQIYNTCIQEPYGFMSISYQNDKDHKLIRNFEEFFIVG
jgi:hypothetical protein